MKSISIDTSSNEIIKVGLVIDGEKDIVEEKIGKQKAQVVLPLLEKLFKKHGISMQEIEGIEVSTGPGSFTGLRVGIAIANTLGLFLQIPINGKKIGQLVEAKYT
jgi:tRNA threonylcarbamoyladenosine biosynthesis protein TsaB